MTDKKERPPIGSTGPLAGLMVGPGDRVLSKGTEFIAFAGKNRYNWTTWATTSDGDWIIAGNNICTLLSRADSGPVRTVTKKEIIPGVYGNVCYTYEGEVNMKATHDKKTLAAAIKTLTEIMEAME